MLKLLFGLLGLGVVVFIHELGHLLAAKLVGIGVKAFSIGWGPKLLSVTLGGTDYRLSLFPIGGYCSLKGEDAMKAAWMSGADSVDAEKSSFYGTPPWKRIIVTIAGPVANLLFAIAAFSFVWLIGFSYPTFSNRIILESDYPSRPDEKVYPAAAAGLATGDYIIAVDGDDIRTYRDLQETVARNPGKALSVTYRRGEKTSTVTLTPELNKDTGAGRIGVYAWVEPFVDEVGKDSAAYIAGIKRGDKIVRIDGKSVSHTMEIAAALRGAGSAPLKFEIEREGRLVTTTVIPHVDETGRPELGVAFKPIEFSSKEVGVVEALRLGIGETFSTLAMTVKGIGLLFRGVNLSQAVSGPLRITYFVGEIAAQGFSKTLKDGVTSILNFLSLLSVTLFFMNLLPIPALDGGFLIIFLLEIILHRSPRPRFLYRYQYAGLVIILVLIILSTMSDFFYFFRR